MSSFSFILGGAILGYLAGLQLIEICQSQAGGNPMGYSVCNDGHYRVKGVFFGTVIGLLKVLFSPKRNYYTPR